MSDEIGLPVLTVQFNAAAPHTLTLGTKKGMVMDEMSGVVSTSGLDCRRGVAAKY